MKSTIAGALMVVILHAQNPDTLWTRVFGGENHDCGNAVRICPDSGYIVCGSTASFGAGGWDVYLVRTDDKGDTLWTRTYGGSDNDYGCDVDLTRDRGYIIGGYTRSFGNGGHDLYLIRVDSLGDTIWTRTFGGANDDEGYSVRETPDFGYLLCGTTYSFGAGIGDIYLVKTDSLGDSLWSKTYGDDDNDLGADVAVLPDSGLMLCGTTYSYGAGGGDVYLIRTNYKGDTLWTRTHGGESDDWGYGIAATQDSCFVVAGSAYFSLLGDDWFVFKADRDGNVQWNYFNGSLGDDYAYAAVEIPGRGYMICGNFSFELFVVRTDILGNGQQQWIFGGAGTDCARDAAVHRDGSYAIVGNTTSFGHGMTDIWLIKMASDTLGIMEDYPRHIENNRVWIYPNPSRREVKVKFEYRNPNSETNFNEPNFKNSPNSKITLAIFDVTGRKVKNLLLTASCFLLNTFVWDGSDNAGQPVPAGVYLLEYESGGVNNTAAIIRLD